MISRFKNYGLKMRGDKYIKNSDRDGIKSRGDKIGMPCTHSTVI